MAEAWTRQMLREDAAKRGVKVMNMHSLNATTEQFTMRRGRLMAAQATVMQRIDLKEAATTMIRAILMAPHDGVILR